MKFKYSTLKTIHNNLWFGPDHEYLNFRHALTAFLSDKDWIMCFIDDLEHDIKLTQDDDWMREHNQMYASTVVELKQFIQKYH